MGMDPTNLHQEAQVAIEWVKTHVSLSTWEAVQ